MSGKVVACPLMLWLCSGCGLVVGCEEDIPPIDMVDAAMDGARTDAGNGDAGDLDSGGIDSGRDSGGIDATLVDSGADTGTSCGNRVIEAPEQCDDGNTMPGDGCDASCQREPSPSCGDSIVDYASGEECDDGNAATGDGCAMCRVETPPACGDGALDIAVGEQCDDGNTNPGDGCSPSCQFEPVGAFCGDDRMDVGEVCDDGNVANGDACNPTCNFENRTSLFVGMVGMPGRTDGIGTAARVGGFGGLAADDTYLWLADGSSRTIRRIEIATADVQTVAGDGRMMVADAPNGANASFQGPEGIATDGSTVWVVEAGRLRAIQATAPFAVTTVAGGPRCGNPICYADGVGAAATFDDIRGATYYGGYVWLLDGAAAVLRRFDPATNRVVTVAGMPYQRGSNDGIGGAGRFQSPRYMASDNSGMLYIADTNGAKIRAFNTVTDELSTYAGNGTQGYVDGVGTAAQIHRPRGMTSDGTSIYWVEFNQHTIRQGVLATQDVSTMIGTPGMNGYREGTGRRARLTGPFGLAYHFPSRSLFVLDGGNNVIRRIE